ncbi:MAG: hypothetical protein JXJ22_10420 [Bacteroidales bacterium]|nr:hypothetical protein [Bacteroidales bacterium]
MEKRCLQCGDMIIGRVDKKFCTDQCRSTYNNNLRQDINNLVKKINYTIRKNRRILADFNPNGKSKVHQSDLMDKGFNFNYYTNTFTTKRGSIYYFCYDQGYLPIDKGYYALVHKLDYVN